MNLVSTFKFKGDGIKSKNSQYFSQELIKKNRDSICIVKA